jgi:hypothetical protein
VPGPASTSSGPPEWLTTRCCPSSSSGTRGGGTGLRTRWQPGACLSTDTGLPFGGCCWLRGVVAGSDSSPADPSDSPPWFCRRRSPHPARWPPRHRPPAASTGKDLKAILPNGAGRPPPVKHQHTRLSLPVKTEIRSRIVNEILSHLVSITMETGCDRTPSGRDTYVMQRKVLL